MPIPVIVVDYDPNWPRIFETLRQRIAEALGDAAAAIEHVGSTAVPGLAAKPIIDTDVLLASETLLPVAIERLASLGYVHQGNLGIQEREACGRTNESGARRAEVSRGPEYTVVTRHYYSI
jgi:GrpB-like predicted nucleotidyltransferase (UPF0157 family)